MAANELSILWSQNKGGYARHATQLAASTTIKKGALAILAGGVVTPLVSGTALNTLCTTIAGADGNGGLVFRSEESNVRVALLAGATKTLGVTVSFANAGFVDVIVQQGTDGGGLVTSTAALTVQAIRSSGLANELLHVIYTGTGAGLTATTSATAINKLVLLGAADETYANTTVSVLTGNMTFYIGTFGLCIGKTGDVPGVANIGAHVTLVDDSFTVAATLDPMAFTGKLEDIDFRGRPHVKIC
jgi:hypothetical protein